MTRLYVLCVMAFAPAVALADAPAVPATDPSVAERIILAEKTADEDEIVCEKVASTGTRFTTRVCKTRKQIEEERQRARDATEAVHRDGVIQKQRGG